MSEARLQGHSLADQTFTRVRDALSHNETICVTKVLEIVQEMSDKADRLSVQDLADVIGRDLATVAKIMRAAHCLGYNPGAADVTTLGEAISLMGFETIRNLAVSLLLMESAEKGNGANESSEISAQALSSALLAQVIVQQTTSINPHQAFVCSALRHYGRLLLSTFLIEEYREALSLAKNMSLNAACTSVFGLTPLELGHQILSEAHLSKLIAHTLQEAGPGVIRADCLSEPDHLLVISEFSSRLCEIMDTPGLSCGEFETRSTQLLKKYARSVALTDGDLKEVLGRVEELLAAFGRAQGMDPFSNPLMNRIRLLAADKRLEPIAHPMPTNMIPDEPGAPWRSPEPIAAAGIEVKRLMAAGPVDSRQVFAIAARAIKAGLGLRSCLVFLQEAHGPMYAATVGSGAFFEAIRNQAVLDPHQKDVFTVCLTRGEDLLIQDPDDPRITPFIPDWFKRIASNGPFVCFPIKDGAGTFAIVCGTVGKAGHIDLNDAAMQQLKTLRAHLSLLRDATQQQREAA